MADKEKDKTIREEKKQTVEQIVEKINKSKEMVLVDYRGLSVKDMADLRSELRKTGVELKIYKNTLAKIAVKKTGYQDLNQYLAGPTAIAFDYNDEVTTPKVLVNFAKENEALELKGGLLDSDIIDVNQINTLASLPSKEELIAKAVGNLAGTIRSLLYVLNGPVESFSRVVKQIAGS